MQITCSRPHGALGICSEMQTDTERLMASMWEYGTVLYAVLCALRWLLPGFTGIWRVLLVSEIHVVVKIQIRAQWKW